MYKRTNLTAKKLYLLLFTLFITNHYFSQTQKIGLVLSGGGATGFAHIGVLKALEENGIPIDYITGTSAGALIGSMYASGMSPAEIETKVVSDDFQLMANGELKPSQQFLLREPAPNAGMFNLSFSKDSLLRKSLPTNFVSSSYLDFEMMSFLGPVSASNNHDFDNLFVPFRCVASDIAKNESVIFKNGPLNAAVRASMTYPFFFKPTEINGVLLFDGGLYNNFPADVMYEDFNPDFIIGSNVSYNASKPEADNLISQLTNMLVRYSDYNLPCEQGFIISPKTNVGTFSFEDIQQAINDGYEQTLSQIDSLKKNITHFVDSSDLAKRRIDFKSRIRPILINQIETVNNNDKISYTKSALFKKNKKEILTLEEIEKRYFRMYAASQVDFIFPTISMNSDSTYTMSNDIRKSKDFIIDIGGHISSRPVNTGYIGLTYQTLGKTLTSTKLESYFGKFYGSAKASFTLDLPVVYPISTSIYFTLNRWDYFRSFATFFEDVKPSFLIQNEMYAGLKLKLPVGNTWVGAIEGNVFKLDDSYYQSDKFTNKDTSDITNFNGLSTNWSFAKNTLNRKQFASGGHLFSINARYVYGREHAIPGSTSINKNETIKLHHWLNIGIDYQSFLIDEQNFHFGLHGQLVYNSQSLFANYTSSLLAMTEFSLVPDAKTYFLPEYRSPQFIGAGMNVIFTIKKRIDLRIDGYVYQPFMQVIENIDGTLSLSKPFKGETFMASTSAIYHSPVGPLRATLNYFPLQTNPLAFQISLGYVLFNDRAIR